MFDKAIEVIANNLFNILLVIVGASALFVYWVQERRKISEAASLIIMQIEDLQKNIREISSYISEGSLNDTAFYESQSMFKTDYWNKYKHYFIRKLDSFSFNTFDEFYNCAAEILEQQELMINLQKHFFFLSQQIIMQMEANLILQSLNLYNKNPVDINNVVEGLTAGIPNFMNNEQKHSIENLLKLFGILNQNRDFDQFLNIYNKEKQNIIMAINRNALDRYTPMQIRISLEKALKKLNMISIIGCEGYLKMKKIAGRKF